MDRVKGKVAIVTGAAGVLGKAMVMLLAKEGAKVVATDIVGTGAETLTREVEQQGGQAVFLSHDVSSEEDWQRVINETMSRFGRLDVLVNDAGVMLSKAIEEMTLGDWHGVLRVNLDSVFLGTKCVIEPMKKSGGGSIINISSVAGLVGMGGGSSAYSASKGGIRSFTKASALQLSKAGGRDFNIRVNSIHPAMVVTPLMESLFRAEAEKTGKTVEQVRKIREDWTLLGRLGRPDDIAYAVLYLASDESSWVTGTELVVDGGFTAK